jgi:hypothetical protein
MMKGSASGWLLLAVAKASQTSGGRRCDACFHVRHRDNERMKDIILEGKLTSLHAKEQCNVDDVVILIVEVHVDVNPNLLRP